MGSTWSRQIPEVKPYHAIALVMCRSRREAVVLAPYSKKVKNNAKSDTTTLSHRQQSAPRTIVACLLWVLLPLHVLRKLYSDSEDSYVPVRGIE